MLETNKITAAFLTYNYDMTQQASERWNSEQRQQQFLKMEKLKNKQLAEETGLSPSHWMQLRKKVHSAAIILSIYSINNPFV